MGIVFRQSAKNAIIVAIGAALGALTIWLSTRFTTQQQLGFTRTITTYGVTFSLVLIAGLNSTMVTYIHRYTNNLSKRKLLTTLCFILPALFLGFATVVFCIFRSSFLRNFQPEDVPFMKQYFLWIPLYILFFIYMTLFEQYLGSQMKVAVSAFMREVVLRLAIILLLFLFGFGYISFDTFVKSSILIYLLPLLIFMVLCVKTKGFGISFRFRDFSEKEYHEMVHFSWYHFLLSIAILMFGYLDALLIPIFDKNGFSAAGVYGIAVYLISLLQLPFKALMPASFTVLAKAFAEDDMVKAKDLFIRSSNNIFVLSIGVAVLMVCNLQNAVAIIKHGYSEIIPVFLILFIGNIVNIATGMNDQILSIAKYYKFNFYLSSVLIVLLYLMIRFLVPRYGLIGAAWSTTTILMVFNIVKCWFVWKKLNMQPFSVNTIKILMAALPALAAGYFYPYFFNPDRHVYVHTFIDAAMRCSVIVVIYVIMLLWLKPSKDLEEYLVSVRKNKRLF